MPQEIAVQRAAKPLHPTHCYPGKAYMSNAVEADSNSLPYNSAGFSLYLPEKRAKYGHCETFTSQKLEPKKPYRT